MEVKLQDSLDSICLQKQRAKEEKQRTVLIQIKQKFITSLQKLQSSQTRQIALSQIKKLIDQNREQQHLRIYISILKNLKPNSNSTTKEHQILVISILTQLFNKNLIDPIDKPPSLMKTCFRLVQIIHSYFADTSGTVQQACAKALLDITNYCITEQSNQNILSLIYSPLSSILKSGVDKASQATASVCINQLVQFWTKTKNNQIVQEISKDILVLVLKLSTQYNQFFIALNTLVQYKGMPFFQNKLTQFVSKVLGILNSKKQNNFNNYMCKVYVCKIMEFIGDNLNKNQRQKFQDMEVQSSIQRASRNRIIQVQMAANRALKSWKGQPKTNLQAKTYSKPFVSLEQMRNNKKRQKSLSKDKQKIQSTMTFIKEDLDKMVQGGWGAHQRAKNFVKRGTGVGGGFYGGVDVSPPQKSNKSHKQHIQQLKDFIQKQSFQNKGKQKFSFYPQKQQRKQRSPPPSYKNGCQINNNKKNKTPPSNLQKHKSNKNFEFQGQFQIEQDGGDQMINEKNHKKFKAKQKSKKINTQQMEKYQSIMQHVDKNEINQLLEHEKSLLQGQQNNKIQRSIQLELQSKHQKQIKNNVQSQPNSQRGSNKMLSQQQIQLRKQKKLQQYYAGVIQPVQKEIPQILKSLSKQNSDDQKNQRQNNFENQYKYDISKKSLPREKNNILQSINKQKNLNFKNNVLFSEEEIGDIIMENNLSQVSENLNSIISQNDKKIGRQQLNMVDSNILGQQNQAAKIRSIIQQKSMSKSRNSIMKFIKKEEFQPQNLQIKGDSLNFSQSKKSRNSPQKQFQLSPVKMDRKQQFTLNPQNKFDSQAHIVNNNYEEVQEQIDQSHFQQSIPRQQRLRNIMKQAKKIKIEDNEQLSQQKGKVYLNVIKNPPKIAQKSRFVDRKSEMNPLSSKGSQISKEDIYNDEQDLITPITQQWVQILASIQNDDINQAYTRTFQMDDPIYLLRLMLLTKAPLRRLTAQNTSILWKKFLQIYNHKFIDAMSVQLFSRANDMGMLKNSLSIEELQSLLLQLYQISGSTKGKLSFNAATLYNSIQQSIKGKQSQ